ncbi:MAG TPA: response regulator [Polyangiaceae bacterium]|jgi:CheY-like chemotaxis protein
MTMHPTVLVVEDDEELRGILKDALEAEGFDIVVAAEGRQALDATSRIEHLGLVILDLLMPGMNGWDFFNAMKADVALAKIPIVVVTSSPSQAPSGANRIMQKPLKLERVVSTVREFCVSS